MVDRLDEEQIEILKKWSARLATDARAELRAAGKAIVLLIDEIERLQLDKPHARGASNTALVEANTSEAYQESLEAVSTPSLATSLRERLGAAIPSRATFDRDV